jgi:glycosyltransferase involved in cell wall biosynthesis
MLVPVQWEEPFGIVFVESLACGTPVISTPRGALPEIVRNNQEGYLCQTVQDMIAAIGQIPAIDRKACRERVERMFSADQVTERYETLYRILSTGGKNQRLEQCSGR